MKDGDSFTIRYKAFLEEDETYFWYETVKFIVSAQRDEATAVSDESLTLLPDWISQEGSVLPLPEHAGDVIEGEEYIVYAEWRDSTMIRVWLRYLNAQIKTCTRIRMP